MCVCVWGGGDSCGVDSHLLQLMGSCQEAAGCSKVTAGASAVDLAIAVGCRPLCVGVVVLLHGNVPQFGGLGTGGGGHWVCGCHFNNEEHD